MTNSSQDLNPAYGYLWWLNGKESYIAPSSPMSIPGPIAPNAPDDLITAAGAQGQFISISKSSGMIMIRQGLSEDKSLAALPMIDEIWLRISAFEDESCQTITSVSEETLGSVIIYPNPANRKIQISGIETGSEYAISLIDNSGKKLMTRHNQSIIDISSIQQGNYFIEIVSDKKAIYKRLILE